MKNILKSATNHFFLSSLYVKVKNQNEEVEG